MAPVLGVFLPKILFKADLAWMEDRGVPTGGGISSCFIFFSGGPTFSFLQEGKPRGPRGRCLGLVSLLWVCGQDGSCELAPGPFHCCPQPWWCVSDVSVQGLQNTHCSICQPCPALCSHPVLKFERRVHWAQPPIV